MSESISVHCHPTKDKVDSIVGHRLLGTQYQYLVKWKPEVSNLQYTWFSKSDFPDPDIIFEYMDKMMIQCSPPEHEIVILGLGRLQGQDYIRFYYKKTGEIFEEPEENVRDRFMQELLCYYEKHADFYSDSSDAE